MADHRAQRASDTRLTSRLAAWLGRGRHRKDGFESGRPSTKRQDPRRPGEHRLSVRQESLTPQAADPAGQVKPQPQRLVRERKPEFNGTPVEPFMVGPYEVFLELGEGGMAKVYLAHDTRPGRKRKLTAVKVMNDGHENSPTSPDRFRRESATMRRVSGRHVVRFYEASVDGEGGGEGSSKAYVAMEPISGTTLREQSDAGVSRTLPEILRLIAEGAQGLDEIHRSGVVHRDVNPRNMMLDETGTLKVTDFGVSIFHSEESKLTKTGVIIGSADYMSPRVLRGQRSKAGDDFYALGCVMTFLATGEAPSTFATGKDEMPFFSRAIWHTEGAFRKDGKAEGKLLGHVGSREFVELVKYLMNEENLDVINGDMIAKWANKLANELEAQGLNERRFGGGAPVETSRDGRTTTFTEVYPQSKGFDVTLN